MSMAASAKARRRSSVLPWASSEHRVARTRARIGMKQGQRARVPAPEPRPSPHRLRPPRVEPPIIGQARSHQAVDIAGWPPDTPRREGCCETTGPRSDAEQSRVR